MNPYVVELFAGTMSGTAGFMELGVPSIGFDLEYKDYHGPVHPLGQRVIQDVTTLHGAQFKDALFIWGSPPCTEYSFMAMPWKRGKQIARALRGADTFPDGYKGSRTIAELNRLFYACFRIQIEACATAGRYIPLIVENVRGAQPWVGRSKWNYGSFHLWGDVPALMPFARSAGKSSLGLFHWEGKPEFGVSDDGVKGFTPNGEPRGKNKAARLYGSKSPQRKAASAQIAKIPLPLSRHIARVYHP